MHNLSSSLSLKIFTTSYTIVSCYGDIFFLNNKEYNMPKPVSWKSIMTLRKSTSLRDELPSAQAHTSGLSKKD